MSPPRFFMDEDMHAAVIRSVRAAGFDAIGVPETFRLGEPDASQLDFAVRERRTLVTFNVGDFVRLHSSWMAARESHCGIVVHRQPNVGDTVKRLLRLAKTLEAEALIDRLEFLSDW